MGNSSSERYLVIRNPPAEKVNEVKRRLCKEKDDEGYDELIDLEMSLYTGFEGNYVWGKDNILTRTEKRIGNVPKKRKFSAEIELPCDYLELQEHFDGNSAKIRLDHQGRKLLGKIVAAKIGREYSVCRLEGIGF